VTRTSIRILLGLLAVLALGFSFAACGDEDDGSSPAGQSTSADGAPSAEDKAANKITPVANAGQTSITIGSKDFPEQFVLGELYAQALDAAGYNVKKDLNLGPEVVAYQALRQGEVDAYPEYTGTSLTAFFDVKVEDVPRDPAQAYKDAAAAYDKKGITAFEPTPFENSYRVGMTKAKAKELGNPTKTSDLKDKAPELTLNGHAACRQRIDCLLGLQRTYGLKFKKFLPGKEKYQILDNGDADVAMVFTTDGELDSDKYVVLEDDKNLWPPYNISLGVRKAVAAKLGEEGKQVIQSVQKNLTEENMIELNARVVVDKQKPEKVVADFLKFYGYTS
jgi:glycine betaine/choline ABC-type transport system substrate-binding protein